MAPFRNVSNAPAELEGPSCSLWLAATKISGSPSPSKSNGFGAGTLVFGLSSNFWLALVMRATLGAEDNISVVIRHVLVIARTPEHVRGRVGAVNSVFIECSNELGGFESGLVARFFGPVYSVGSGGIGTLLVVIGIAWWLPELRKLGRLAAREPG